MSDICGMYSKHHSTSERHIRIANVTLNSHLVLFVTEHRHVLQMLSSDTWAMGRFLDVV